MQAGSLFTGDRPLPRSRSDHPDSNRQLNLCIVPKTPGRHQGAPSDLPDLGVVPSLHGSQHPAGSSTSSRQIEHSGRSAQQSDQASSQQAHLCQPLPGPSGIRHTHPEHGVGHSSLSVPLPYITHPSGGAADGEHIPGHCPALASPVMVPRLNQSFRGSSPVPPKTGGSSGSGPSQEVLCSPQPGFVPIPRLAVVREHLQTADFSASTADRIALPQRDSTG